MPFTFYLSSENQLSIQNIEALQNAARANDTGNIIIGDRQFSVRYQSAMDAFIVNPVQGELYSGLNNTALDDVLSLADVIESRLNGGSSFLDVFDRYMIQTMQTMMNGNEGDLGSLATRLSSSAFFLLRIYPVYRRHCSVRLHWQFQSVVFFLETPRNPLCVVYMMKMLSLV